MGAQCALPGGHASNHVYTPGDLLLAACTIAEAIGTSVHEVFDNMGMSAADLAAITTAARAEVIH